MFFCLFFFNDTATTEIYTLSLHDALPICPERRQPHPSADRHRSHLASRRQRHEPLHRVRSEEHTSELQSPCNLVCRLLLEKKKHTGSPCPSRYPSSRPPASDRSLLPPSYS